MNLNRAINMSFYIFILMNLITFQARLKCVEFHPSARVMLTAGLNQKLTLFQVSFIQKQMIFIIKILMTYCFYF